jgi:RNA polymerase sigma-70 factor (ECF subfamily)
MVPSGESRVLQRVFARSADGLYRFILIRVGGDRHAADDLLQQTCCAAADHRRPPPDEDECEAWLRGIARNLIRRYWRKRKRGPVQMVIEDAALARAMVDELESAPLPLDTLIRKESIEQLLLAITDMPSREQQLIFAYYFDGRSQAAIAAELGVSEKSIESRLYRARGRLRNALRHEERSGER